MSMRYKERGLISVKVLLLLAILAYIVHSAILVVPMYIDAGRMKDEMASKARLAQTLKDEDILADLVRKAKDLGLPLAEDQFVLVRDEESRRMRISTKNGWDVRIRFLMDLYPEYTMKTFHFEPVIDETYSVHL